MFVVGNHLNSKGGDEALFGRFQDPRRFSEIQRRGGTNPNDAQRGQTGVINAWVRRLLNIDRRANVIVLGDMNDFDFSEAVRTLERGRDAQHELFTLWRTLPRAERYSYIFEGNSQPLEQILASPALVAAEPELDAVHINSEFSEQTSDHDPLVSRYELDDDDHDDDDDHHHDEDGEHDD